MNGIQEKYYKYLWLAGFVIFAILSFTLFHDLFLNWKFVKQSKESVPDSQGTSFPCARRSSDSVINPPEHYWKRVPGITC